MTSPAAAGLGPDGPASHLPGRHSSDSGSFKLIKNLLVTAHWDGRSPQRRHRSGVPRSVAEGNIVSKPRRGRHRPRAPWAFGFFGVMSIFDTTSYHKRKKPKPPLIRKNHALAQIFSEALTVTLTGSRPSNVPAVHRPGQALGPPSLPTKFKTIRADCTARSANHYGDAGVR